MIYILPWFILTLTLSYVFFFSRNLGYSDPILRDLIFPVAGIAWLIALAPSENRDIDYYTVFLLIAAPIILLFYSTPSFIPAKSINKNIIMILIVLSISGIGFNLLDIVYNFDFNTSIFNPKVTTFDIRGQLGNSSVKLISMGINLSCTAILAVSNTYRVNKLKFLVIIWLIISLFAGFSSPGKTLLILPAFYILDYIFWSKVLSPKSLTIKKAFNIKRLIISKRALKGFTLLSLVAIILIVSSCIMVSHFMETNKGFIFISNRIFNASYPLSWLVINNQSVFADINYPPSEFSNIFELWFKFLLKNLYKLDYINDTIPKYAISFLTGAKISGEGSMNSNLLVEATFIHGRYLGSLISIIVCFIGAVVRKRSLNSNRIDISIITFLPIISSGPFFCFQSAQSFFTMYIPYIFIIVFAVLLNSFINLIRVKNI